MTLEDAQKIFKAWQEYSEINDKLMKVFLGITLPESFLPYPLEDLEEATNIIAKTYFDAGDYKTMKQVQEVIGFLTAYKDDEKALESIRKGLDFVLQNPELKKAVLENLKEAQESWVEFKNSG